MVLKQARVVRCALAIAGSVDWKVRIGRTKKNRATPGSGLKWPPFDDGKQQSSDER